MIDISRKLKNILVVIMIFIVLAATCFTVYISKKSSNLDNNINTSETMNNSNKQKSSVGTPPDKPNSNSNGSDSNNTNNTDESSNKSAPPQMPNENNTTNNNTNESSGNVNNSNTNNQNTPPQMPNENNATNNNTSGSSGNVNDSNTNNQNTPPQMPNGSISGNENNSNMNGPAFTSSNLNTSKNIDAVYIVLFSVEGLLLSVLIMYLVMSNFNKKDLKKTFESSEKIIIFILSVIILTGITTFSTTKITESISNNKNMISENSNTSIKASGKTTVNKTKTENNKKYSSSSSDESAILVQNGGNLTLSNGTITKKGDSSNTENSEFYGVNSGILVTKDSTLTVKNTNITTDAKGSNAVFATGENAKIYITDSVIKTTGNSSSRGLDATYGGYIKADKVSITTNGSSCATLATDRGEGTVIADNSTLETNGSGSPIIYSTGDISIDNTKGIANGSQMVVIEGKNKATVTNSSLTASASPNRKEVDQAGVMIYQSMSGDANEGVGIFTSKNSKLTIDENSNYYKTAPMFFITNTDAKINLTNTKLSYGSNILISAKATSEWGNSGSNGANVTLNAKKQDLTGDIEVDNISTLTLNLKSKSSYKGSINKNNTAKKITLKLDKTSTITLTGDSYVTSLQDADTTYSNINFNGYKLYVNGKAIN